MTAKTAPVDHTHFCESGGHWWTHTDDHQCRYMADEKGFVRKDCPEHEVKA